MKKFLSVTFVLLLLFSFSFAAFASDDLEILPDKYKVGDVDMDGDISIVDATLVQRHLAQIDVLSSKQLELADTNFDASVSISDATRIQMHVAGLLDITKPEEEPTEDDDKPIELPFVPAK